MYEGAPNCPEPDRFWKIIDDHKVTIFYTAPTAIRAFIEVGRAVGARSTRSASLRLLGTVGEPINPEAWMWYHREIGKERCPIVDTWWQTETGAIMISPLPGAMPTKPGSATLPFSGNCAEVVTKEGKPVPAGQGGLLVIRKPWPSMARTIYGDPERYRSRPTGREVPGAYFTGDGARHDADGYFWLMGRVDDVINVSGHRLGTMEVESALVAHPKVAEAAVVGRPDDMKGQAICRVRHARGRARTVRRSCKAGAARSGWRRRSAHWRVRTISFHRAAAEDAQRQDHAAAAARAGDARGDQGRHHDARRLQRDREAAGAGGIKAAKDRVAMDRVAKGRVAKSRVAEGAGS